MARKVSSQLTCNNADAVDVCGHHRASTEMDFGDRGTVTDHFRLVIVKGGSIHLVGIA